MQNSKHQVGDVEVDNMLLVASVSCADDKTVLMLASPAVAFTLFCPSCALAFTSEDTVLAIRDLEGG